MAVPWQCLAIPGNGRKAISDFQLTMPLDDFPIMLICFFLCKTSSTQEGFIYVRCHNCRGGRTNILCWHLPAGNKVHMRETTTINFPFTPHGLLGGDILNLVCISRSCKNVRLSEGDYKWLNHTPVDLGMNRYNLSEQPCSRLVKNVILPDFHRLCMS